MSTGTHQHLQDFAGASWLPIKWRVDYKVATLTYKLLKSGEPTYLWSSITSKIFQRALKSSADDRQLEPFSSHTKIGSHACRCAASTISNCLPYDIRAAPSFSNFRSRLKTYYFKLALQNHTLVLNVHEINFFMRLRFNLTIDFTIWHVRYINFSNNKN